MKVILATCTAFPEGEPGHELLDAALAERGVDATWAVWDDPDVDWGAADLVAVRATWDYVERPEAFLAWARRVEGVIRLLNGSDVMAWNMDKAYLVALGEGGQVPVVPSRLLEGPDDLARARGEWGDVVVKPRVGAGGVGVVVVGAEEPLSAVDLPAGDLLVQPLVHSVRDAGELSVFVLGGRPAAQVRKVPGPGEVRVHEHLGGTYARASLDAAVVGRAVAGFEAAGELVGRALDYGRVDLLLHEGEWKVSELELIEPALYLELCPENVEPYVEAVLRRLA
ncbi:ATP-grasp domain-containing protein [Nocardioides jishulii]|nr:hypothetical protein [Nocardioides jishulii]